MLAYRYARTADGDEQQLYNERLSELWEEYDLPDHLWPGGHER